MSLIKRTFTKAMEHFQAGQLQQAEQCCHQVLKSAPQHLEAFHLLGAIAYHSRQGDLAVQFFRQVLRLQPNHVHALNNLGLILHAQGKLQEAETCCRQAIQIQPTFAEAFNNLGNILRSQRKHQEAAACLQQAVRLNPQYVDAHNNLGLVLTDLGRLSEAEAHCRQALQIMPTFAEAYNNLASVLKRRDRLEEAAGSYRQAIRLQPGMAVAYSNLGLTLHELGYFDEAAASCREAIRLQPNYAGAHNNLGISRLLQGDYLAGWPEHEWRLWCEGGLMPRFPQPMWDGSRLDGRTILLHAEQGLGDTVQFIRYGAIAKQLGGRVLLACQRTLLALLRRYRFIDAIYTEGDAVPAFDVYAPLLSLPYCLGQYSVEQFPHDVPYLDCDPQLLDQWRRRLQSVTGFRIGIAWQGNPAHMNDHRRSLPVTHFVGLAQVPNVSLISLQKGPGREQLQQTPGLALDLGNELADLSDTAAVLSTLDLVICVDTAVAHLAGALGVPTCLAIPFIPDWRWQLQRDDSPWYPTMRLFRQRQHHDWNDVFVRLKQALVEREPWKKMPK
jgi:Flp pilus assembly protein TadD